MHCYRQLMLLLSELVQRNIGTVRSGYIPNAGVIIVYSDYGSTVIDGETVPVAGIKIGSGNAYVQDLAFIGDDVKAALLNHIADDSVHITPEDRAFWDNKLNVTDYREVVDETLVFHRN